MCSSWRHFALPPILGVLPSLCWMPASSVASNARLFLWLQPRLGTDSSGHFCAAQRLLGPQQKGWYLCDDSVSSTVATVLPAWFENSVSLVWAIRAWKMCSLATHLSQNNGFQNVEVLQFFSHEVRRLLLVAWHLLL